MSYKNKKIIVLFCTFSRSSKSSTSNPYSNYSHYGNNGYAGYPHKSNPYSHNGSYTNGPHKNGGVYAAYSDVYSKGDRYSNGRGHSDPYDGRYRDRGVYSKGGSYKDAYDAYNGKDGMYRNPAYESTDSWVKPPYSRQSYPQRSSKSSSTGYAYPSSYSHGRY